MFTCPLHQWASHELPCPACQQSGSFTSSGTDFIVNPAAPPDEGQEELWGQVGAIFYGAVSFQWYDDKLKPLMQQFHITKKQ